MTAQTTQDSDEIDLGQLFLTLWKGKAVIAATTAVGIAVGAFTIANTFPTFQADALLQLEEKTGSLSLPSSLSPMLESDPRSVTEIEILRSRMVLGRAVADQNLDWRVTPEVLPLVGTMFARYDLPVISSLIPSRYARPGDGLRLEQLVVPPDWVNAPLSLTVGEAGAFTLVLPDGTALEGQTGQQILHAAGSFTITVAELRAAPGRAFTISQIDEARALESLRERLSVTERGRSSGILEVRLTGPDREESARALNAVVQAYLRQNVNRSAAQAESSLQFIEEQLPIAEANLREAEAALNAFRQEQVTIDLSLETQTILGQITRTEEALAALDSEEAELRERYTEAHPVYRQLLDERARQQERLAELRNQVGALPETQRQILNLTSAVELAQRIYTELLTRSQEVSVLRASTIGNVRIVDTASAGTRPIAPRKTVILGLATLLGALGGIGIVLVQNWLRRGIRDSSDLEKLGLPVFATINYVKEADTSSRRHGTLPIHTLTHPDDLSTEAFRSLRTALHFGMLDARTPSVGITSSHPGAGKSFVAANLAVVAAQAGQRVCLIDADLRRGHLRRYFNVPKDEPGLAEVLARDIPADQALIGGPVDNLWFISTGRYPPNPSELLMRAELSELVEWCAAHFDLTIFDMPPVLAVTDPVILARTIGTSLFVARHDVSLIGEVDASLKTFAAAGVRLSGAILNGFDPRKAGPGYGYGYGYGYRYTYEKRDE